MIRAFVGGATVVWLAFAIPPDAAADFADGVRAYNSDDYVAAHAAWLPLAQDGDAAAARNLGHLYRTGRGVGTDLARALRWYRRAAEQGFAGAQANLGSMYARGQGIAASYATAAMWFHRAAVQGHMPAQYNLGLLYEYGLGVESSEEMAMAWYHKAAGAGHQGALERLSRLVAGGATPAGAVELTLEPPGEAMEPSAAQPPPAEPDPATLSVAERLGIGRAAFHSGDYASALEAWRPLAEAGNAIAQFRMGNLYADGTGVPADPAEARNWWARAAAQGHDRAAQLLAAPAPDQLVVAAPPDPPMAPEMSEMPAPAEVTAVAVASEPTGAEAPPEPAAPALDESAPPAATADTVLDEAALAGLRGAERLRAGVAAYRAGNYTITAAAWLPLAEAGNAWAQFYIGGLTHDGDGKVTDLARAYMWWTLAARQGHQGARELLAELEPNMDTDARVEAEALATVWRPRE